MGHPIRPLKMVRSLLREREKTEKRSSHWPAVRDRYLKDHDECAACGGKTLLQVHHVDPFHEHPELELDPANFITLCSLRGCHLEIGHGDDFHHFNPRVRQDAEIVRKNPAVRKVVVAEAKIARIEMKTAA